MKGNCMNFDKLEKNIMNIINEQQIKLGYLGEAVRLYYPLRSINHLLGKKLDTEKALEVLKKFSDSVKDKFGEISISVKQERFCIIIPSKGSEYVHNLAGSNEFLSDFIESIAKTRDIKEVEKIFYKYSSDVTVKYLKYSDFDYLIYFTNAQPDAFYYCINKELSHLTYHRFTKEDYLEMFPEE